MFKVTFSFEDGSVVEHFANAGDNLLELAREANVAIDAPCSGNASCGKCRVQLKKGELDSKKTLHISEEEYQAVSYTHLSSTGLKAFTNAGTLSLVYVRRLAASPGVTLPKISAARSATGTGAWS